MTETFNDEIAKKQREKEGKEGKEKLDAVNTAIAAIDKKFGKGSIKKLGEDDYTEFPHIPTGALTLDIALGIGGLPRGRIVELYGPSSSGKTTVALTTVANAQKEGGVAAYIDAEHALDPSFAKLLGVNVDDLLVSQPDCGEDGLDILDSLIKTNAIDIIIVDSVSALVPRAELEGEMGQAHMAVQARLMGQAMRKITGSLSRSQTMVIFINQVRDRIGGYGPSTTTSGGNALRFFASVRMEIKKKEQLKKGEDNIYGNRVNVKIVKSKISAPFKTAEFDILFASGINTEGCILDLAAEKDIIHKAGSWYSYGDLRIGQGRENSYQWLKDNPDKCDEIEKKIREMINNPDMKKTDKKKRPSKIVEEKDVTSDAVEISDEDS